MANRTDLYIEGKFRNEADPKDGYPVRDCRDERERRVLEFLVLIVHPDKLGKEGQRGKEKPPSTGRVPTYPVKRRGE